MGFIPTPNSMEGKDLTSPFKNQEAIEARMKDTRVGERASHDFGAWTWELGMMRLKNDGRDGKRGLLPSGDR